MTSLSPATIGEERPPGAGTFHLPFLAGPTPPGACGLSAPPAPPARRTGGHAGALSPPRRAPTNAPPATSAIDPFTFPSSLDVGTDGTGGRRPPRLRSGAGPKPSARGVSP